jgi:hypothetical protein
MKRTIKLEVTVTETELTVDGLRNLIADKLGDALVGKGEDLHISANGHAGLSVDLVA